MSKRLVTMLAGVAVLAMLVAGCGSSDEESLTKAEFVKQGDRLCLLSNEEFVRELEAVYKGAPQDSGPSKATKAQFANETYYPILEARLEQLQDLSPPSSEEDRVGAMLDSFESALEEASASEREPFAPDNPFDKANKLAQEYGLEHCLVL